MTALKHTPRLDRRKHGFEDDPHAGAQFSPARHNCQEELLAGSLVGGENARLALLVYQHHVVSIFAIPLLHARGADGHAGDG